MQMCVTQSNSCYKKDDVDLVWIKIKAPERYCNTHITGMCNNIRTGFLFEISVVNLWDIPIKSVPITLDNRYQQFS